MSDSKLNDLNTPHLDTVIQEHTHSRHPTAQVKVARRAVGETGASLGDEIHLFLSQPDAMGKNGVVTKELELVVYAGVRVRFEVPQRVLDLLLVLRDVGLNGDARHPLSKLAEFGQKLRRARNREARGDDGMDEGFSC
jgi:hypothetical protein